METASPVLKVQAAPPAKETLHKEKGDTFDMGKYSHNYLMGLA